MDEPVTIHNFRDELDEQVLERGWKYFSNGWVGELKEILPGYFEAVVNEVNSHAVSFSLDENDDSLSDVFCTCDDFNNGECRHFAAVLFKLEDQYKSENRLKTWDDIERG